MSKVEGRLDAVLDESSDSGSDSENDQHRNTGEAAIVDTVVRRDLDDEEEEIEYFGGNGSSFGAKSEG